MTRNTKILILSGCLVFLALSILTINAVFAQYMVGTTVAPQTINQHGVCAIVSGAAGYMVPYKTPVEWSAFITYKPASVTVGSCCTGCSMAGVCQAGGGCSDGNCIPLTNIPAGTDPNSHCTASYNSCSGTSRIGPDGNCNGSAACNTGGQSSVCATAGTCQTGGGCSGGSCVGVSNVGAGSDPNGQCTASYNSCSGTSRIGPDGNCNGSAACNTGGLSSDCGGNYWTDSYQCSSVTMRQRYYHSRGCSGSTCYDNASWQDYTECGSDYWADNYSCTGAQPERLYHSRGCSGTSCYDITSWENWGAACGGDYWADSYQCSGTMIQRLYHSRGCSGGSCYDNTSWQNSSDCGGDYWGSSYSCSGTQPTRLYYSVGCSAGSCYNNSSWENWGAACSGSTPNCVNGTCAPEEASECPPVSNCGTDGYVGATYCSGGGSNILQDYKTYSCNSGICDWDYIPDNVVGTCSGNTPYCANGSCVCQYDSDCGGDYVSYDCGMGDYGGIMTNWATVYNVSSGCSAGACYNDYTFVSREACAFPLDPCLVGGGCSGDVCAPITAKCQYGCSNGVCSDPPYCGDSTCDSGEDQCNCSYDCQGTCWCDDVYDQWYCDYSYPDCFWDYSSGSCLYSGQVFN